MNEYLYNTIESFKDDKKSSYQGFIILLSFLLAALFIASCSIKVSDYHEMKAIYNKEKQVLHIVWSYSQIEEIKKIEKIRVDEKEYSMEIKNMSEIMVNENNNQNYQIIDIKSNEIYHNNQVVTIYCITKKELLIHKIKKILLGKENL